MCILFIYLGFCRNKQLQFRFKEIHLNDGLVDVFFVYIHKRFISSIFIAREHHHVIVKKLFTTNEENEIRFT